MNEIFIGLDYSRTSSAMTVISDSGIKSYAFPRRGNIKDKYVETFESAEVTVEIMEHTDAFTNLDNMECSYSYDAELLADNICKAIGKIANGQKIHIGLEGLSFASTGSSILTYAGYHFVLRYVLVKTLGIKYEDIHIFSPGTVKKTAGKGNYKKPEMIEAYIRSEFFAEMKLQQHLISHVELFQSPKAKHWAKPIDDIVDSLWVAKCLYDKIQNDKEKKTKETK
ncbi:MAG: hypothetical protein WC979_01495 [Candidatus Pacearchaeota archaeon]|jgi:hypothetical protein|nr:hypothetical protein [Clostridia bacterium]